MALDNYHLPFYFFHCFPHEWLMLSLHQSSEED